MRKMAQSTCDSCHYIFPRNEMVRVTLSEASGSSVGFTTNLSSTNNRRSNPRGGVRKYFRNRKVWICTACHRASKRSELLSFVFWAVIIVGIVYFSN